MKIAELVAKRNVRVKVRVPADMRERLGETVKGIVKKIKPKGSVTWVEVKVGRANYDFRPQDLSPA